MTDFGTLWNWMSLYVSTFDHSAQVMACALLSQFWQKVRNSLFWVFSLRWRSWKWCVWKSWGSRWCSFGCAWRWDPGSRDCSTRCCSGRRWGWWSTCCCSSSKGWWESCGWGHIDSWQLIDKLACSMFFIWHFNFRWQEDMFWTRLLNHHKGLELQTVTHAAQHASNAEVRAPSAPPLPEPPNEALQDLHRLTHTHTPYQPWCESCVAHRARSDRHPL